MMEISAFPGTRGTRPLVPPRFNARFLAPPWNPKISLYSTSRWWPIPGLRQPPWIQWAKGARPFTFGTRSIIALASRGG